MLVPDVVLIQLSSWGWAQSCSKHVEDSNKHIIEEIVRQFGYLSELYEDARSEIYIYIYIYIFFKKDSILFAHQLISLITSDWSLHCILTRSANFYRKKMLDWNQSYNLWYHIYWTSLVKLHLAKMTIFYVKTRLMNYTC